MEIKRGQHVSWSLGDGFPRYFGRVVRLCTKDFQPAYSVREDGTGIGRIIPARFVKAEPEPPRTGTVSLAQMREADRMDAKFFLDGQGNR